MKRMIIKVTIKSDENCFKFTFFYVYQVARQKNETKPTTEIKKEG